jgi:raffinose/stachyose/melibiose transport system substrate-binding protein
VAEVWTRLRRYPALLLLLIVYAVSTAVVAVNSIRGSGGAPGAERKTVLRMAHWQLEPGIRAAMDKIIADYCELHPNVEVRQILIPEEGYFRWVNTQLIGRTAPDMIECGLGGSAELWQKFYARYFLPLDRYVDEPNPYNEGTDLAGVSWVKTYFDEMEGGYDDALQSYYRVPLSAFTVRLYYNKDLVEDVWGPEFPQTYEEFIQLCEKLEGYGEEHGGKFVPIAGSAYNFRQFFDAYRTALTADYLDVLDTDYNGWASRTESASAFYDGEISLLDPPLRANFELVKELSRYFPPGYMSFDRDQAVFLFIQGHTAMITTGSWDYNSLGVQSEFNIGIAEIPLPSKTNPKYGPYIAGPYTEAGLEGGFAFGVPKMSAHVDEALDFLRYASSLRKNEELNQLMYWLPAIGEATPVEELRPFAPRIEGYTAAVEYEAPGDVALAFRQKRPLYLNGDIPYEEFVDEFMESVYRDLPRGVDDLQINVDRTIEDQMRSAAVRRAALTGVAGARGALTGDPETQLVRILDGLVSQLTGRYHDVGVWETSRRRHESAAP